VNGAVAAGTGLGFSKSEMMIVAAARELAGQRVCFVGVGLPNIAVNLAKRTVAQDMELVYEAGVFGARPARLPLSIGDPTIVTGATAVVSMFELFAFYLQRGLIDVGSWARRRSTGSAISTRR
jgi:glutaconate CoA-transferase subunit B